jgi:phage N-6-adenine-methyltransferase
MEQQILPKRLKMVSEDGKPHPTMSRAALGGRDDWGTPQILFDTLNQEFHFNLDPCADDANRKCDTYHTVRDDGLKQTWKGRVFVNPPYSQNHKWLKKSYESVASGESEVVVVLTTSKTDTSAWHNFIMKAREIRFIMRRIRFNGAPQLAPFPSVIVIFRRTEEAPTFSNCNTDGTPVSELDLKRGRGKRRTSLIR